MPRKSFLALFFLGAALFGWRLGLPDFWEPDEPDFALISREMLESGDWLLPTRNGAPYAEKPPLLYWMVAGLGKLTGAGINGWTGRIPSALCALGTVLAVATVGSRWFSPGVGMGAALALMTMPLWLLKTRYLLTDMPFAAFSTLALLGLGRSLIEGRPPAWWGFAALGLAVLAKGPSAVVLVGLALAAGGLLSRRNPFPFPWRWIPGGLLVLAIAAPWYLAVRAKDPAFFHEVFWKQNLRFFETVSHRRGFHYYLPTLLWNLFPWILPLLAGLPAAWRARKEPALALALGWFGGMLLLLSVSSVKQEKYLLPLLPAAALLAAWALENRPALAGWTARLAGGALVLAAGALAVSACAWPYFMEPALGLAVAALVCAACLYHSRALGPCLAAFYLAVIILGLPVADRFKSDRSFAERAAALAEGKPLAFYGEDLQSAYPFYAKRKVDYLEAPGGERVAAYLREKPDALLILRERDRKRLPEDISSRMTPVLRGRKDIVAVRWSAP